MIRTLINAMRPLVMELQRLAAALTPCPKGNLWDSVQLAEPITRQGFLGRFRCTHRATTKVTVIDHRSGPGSYADVYEGDVCKACGSTFNFRRTY